MTILQSHRTKTKRKGSSHSVKLLCGHRTTVHVGERTITFRTRRCYQCQLPTTFKVARLGPEQVQFSVE